MVEPLAKLLQAVLLRYHSPGSLHGGSTSAHITNALFSQVKIGDIVMGWDLCSMFMCCAVVIMLTVESSGMIPAWNPLNRMSKLINFLAIQ